MPSTLDLAARLSAIVAAQQEILAHANDPAELMDVALRLTQKITKADGAAIEEGDAYRAVAGRALADPGAPLPVGSMLKAPLRNGGFLKVFSQKPNALDDLDAYSVELLAGMISAAVMLAREFRDHRASEERYRLLFEQNVAGVFRTTRDGRILDCNDAFVDYLGYSSRDELLARQSWDLYRQRSDREAFLEQLDRERAMTNVRLHLKRKDGSDVTGIVNVSVIPGDGGEMQLLGTLVAG
jgi:PAS domain S-box-containing protein